MGQVIAHAFCELRTKLFAQAHPIAYPAGGDSLGGMTQYLDYQQPPNMPVTTTFTIDGFRIIRYFGVVRGLIVRAPPSRRGSSAG